MREIDIAFAKVAETIRAQGAVPEEVIVGLETLRGSVGRWLSGATGVLCAPKHGRWIVSPSGVHLDLVRRPTLRRLMAALVDGRVARPGEALSATELIAAAWHETPGGTEASANRLRVALCRLRQFGLGAVIMTTSSGWMLDPSVPFIRDGEADGPSVPTANESGFFPSSMGATAQVA